MAVTDFDSVFDAAPSALLLLDVGLRVLAFNRAFARETGATDTLLGHVVLDYFDEASDRKARLTQAYARAFAGETMTLERESYGLGLRDPSDPERGERYWTIRIAPVGPAPADRIVISVEDRSEEVRVSQMSAAVADELQHRMGNLAALVSVIARQSARSATDVKSYVRGLVARVETLAHATRLLSGTNWRRAAMRDLVGTALSPFDGLAQDRLSVEGPDVALGGAAGQALVMGLHELATNAAKYGALSVPGGRVAISWMHDAGGGLTLEWRETGVEIATPGAHSGFGSTILTQLLPTQLGGAADRSYGPDGLLYTITIGPDHIAAADPTLDTGRTGTYS